MDDERPDRMEKMQIKRKRGRPPKMPRDVDVEEPQKRQQGVECVRCGKGRLHCYRNQDMPSANIPNRVIRYRWRRCSNCGYEPPCTREEINRS